ncbi:hypothetical protein ACIQTZ_05025 [Paenarthrobacter sp. NPDC090520]|uniref:hypothetical protein n=1 Tax=Paenarthrobacter sp. NPDC090520 TaxID=3364382 RepID=UPI0038256433
MRLRSWGSGVAGLAVLAQLENPSPVSSTSTYVLVTASLANDAPLEVQGTKTRLVVGVHGAGDDPGGAPPSGFLSDTGAKLAGFALLGALAVGAGFALSGLRSGTGFRGGRA